MENIGAGRSILFYRDYRRFAGGHLKMLHYFRHLRRMGFDTRVFFTMESKLGSGDPWLREADRFLDDWRPASADILFLGGMDWTALDGRGELVERIPIINFIQSVRHATAGTALYQFLGRRAVRICCSDEVSEALLASGAANGPLYSINNGIDLSELPIAVPFEKKSCRVVIAGLKNPEFANRLRERLAAKNVEVVCLTDFMQRGSFLDALNSSTVVVALPAEQEGLFGVPLEAMALNSIVVTPLVPGNRLVCKDGVNCFAPDYTVDAVVVSTLAALAIPPDQRAKLLAAATETVRQHSIEEEFDRLRNIVASEPLLNREVQNS